MSNLVMFYLKDDIDYKTINLMSKKIIKYCLKNNIGAIFNFYGYSQELISNINPTLYFSISDDFIQLNSEFLTTSHIKYINCKSGENEFVKKFIIFDEIYKIIKSFEVKNCSLLISKDDSTDSLEDFKIINVGSNSIVKVLYKSIIDCCDEFAYDFPNIVLNL